MAVFYDHKADRLSLAVGDLLYLPQSETRDDYHTPGLSLIGQEVHQKYQEKQSRESYSDFESEKRITTTLKIKQTEIIINGRIDNYWTDSGIPIVEEIKTRFQSFGPIIPRDEIQTMLYMWMVKRNNPSFLTVKGLLTYVSPGLELKEQHEISIDNDFEETIIHKLGKILHLQKKEYERLQKRQEVSLQIEWPFQSYRENQVAIVDLVGSSIETRSHVLFESPTGSGKTAPVLYSSLLSGIKNNCRIAFATSRTSQQQNKADFLINNFRPELLGRILVLSSVEKFKRNSMDPVRHFLDPYDPPQWFSEFLDANTLFDIRLIQDTADAMEVDAADLQHELISRVDIIIGDQNLLANPDYRLHSWYTGSRGSRSTILLIDEIHGLSDRLRENRSFTISHRMVKWLMNFLDENHAEIDSTAIAIAGELNLLFTNYFEDEDYKELPQYDVLVETLDIDSILYQLFLHLSQTTDLPDPTFRYNEILDILLKSVRYTQHPWLYSIFIDRNEKSVTWALMDASELYNDLWKKTQATIGFSATLSPMNYSTKDLGFPPGKTTTQSFISQELFAGLHTYRFSGLNTRYRHRHETLNDLTELLRELKDSREGDWLIFFPSREYLFITEQKLKMEGINSVSLTGIGASMLKFFRIQSQDENTLILSLLGGTIAEGFDPGEKELAGIVIVSLGIPPISPKAELIRRSSQLNDEEGRFVAYILPGIRKVQQAAGRLIRKPGQQGVLVLVDDRYSDPEIESILPEHWLLTSPENMMTTLIANIRSL